MHIDPPFTVLTVDLATGRSAVTAFEGSAAHLGGSGLAAALFERHGDPAAPWSDPAQPVVFAVGPLTGFFPAMSKVVCGFVSPHTGEYAESHAGGKLAASIRQAGFDALCLTGRAPHLSTLTAGRGGCRLADARHLAGQDCDAVHRAVAEAASPGAARLSVTVTGPAADNGCSFACATVDVHRHFGRLGLGAALAAKNVKALAVTGDGALAMPDSDAYVALHRGLFRQAAKSPALDKYRGAGTAQIVGQLNALSALPCRNLTASSDPRADALSGERIPYAVPVRKAACAGCPIGCIHLGALQNGGGSSRLVGYDFEHMTCCGSMLGLTDPQDVLRVVDAVERQGMDIMSTGVCLAWATEALARGVVGRAETGLALRFGDAAAYVRAAGLLGTAANAFWRALARGARHAAAVYGGEDFACVLGQEMAGYACGPVFFAAQAMNFRHSHLDNSCYAHDMEHPGASPERAVARLLDDELARVRINCMVACLFARHIYTPDVLADCLDVLGHRTAARDLDTLAADVRARRWRLKFASGFDPDAVRIPKRYREVVTSRGAVTAEDMEAVRVVYARAVRELIA